MNCRTLNGMYSNFIAPEGTNLKSGFYLRATLLSAALSQTVMFLRSLDDGDARLFRYDDWWEHDGLHFPRKDGIIDFDILMSLVETPQAIKESMTGEYNVFVGVAPPNFQWYLRFYYDTDTAIRGQSEEELFGWFDLTLPDKSVDTYRQQVVLPLGLEMQEQESIAYYLSIGMGSYPYSKEEVRKMREDAKKIKNKNEA